MTQNKKQFAGFQISNVKGFISELNLFKTVIKGKCTIPVLECVSIKIEPGKLTITGTDLDNWLITEVLTDTTGAGVFCVHLQTFLDAIRKANGVINVSVFEDVKTETVKGTAKDGTTEPQEIEHTYISLHLSDNSATYEIAGVDFEQFPIIETKPVTFLTSLTESVLQDLLKKTLFAVTRDQSRFTLCAVALEPGKNGLRMIATDGHRLAMADTKDFEQIKVKKTKGNFSSQPPNYLLNMDACKALQRIAAGKTTISTDEHHLIVKTFYGSRTLIARKPSGTFLNYSMVLPKESELTYSFDFHPAEIASVVGAALQCASEKTKTIVFQPYYNNFIVRAQANEKGFTGKATCDFPQNSAPGLSCNGQYLIDACNVANGEILKFAYKNNKLQFRITGENELCEFTTVIMPQNLGENADVKAFQVITDEEKANFPQVPFYRNYTPRKVAETKPDKRQTINDIESLLADLIAIAGTKGMPALFTEITIDTVSEIRSKLSIL